MSDETTTFAVCHEPLAKVAALFFDRVRYHPDIARHDGAPFESTFMLQEAEAIIASPARMLEMMTAIARTNLRGKQLEREAIRIHLCNVASAYRSCGVNVVPLYDKASQFERDFLPGGAIGYLAVLADISVIREDLEWQQVTDFRADAIALGRFRALRTWMSDAFTAKTMAEATDIIGVRLAEYEWTLQKHALTAATGSIKTLLASPTIAAATAIGGISSLLDRPAWALLAAGALTISGIAVSIAERRIEQQDLRRGSYAAIAHVYEARRILNPGA
jgi:hypothetical protein